MTHRTRSLLALTALAAGLGGCAFGFEQPVVRFDGLRLGGLGVRGGTVFAQLHVVNPNRYGLETTSLSYDLEVGGPAGNGDPQWATLATGTYSDPIRVEGRDSAVVEIPIEFTYSQMGGALRSIMERGTVDYRVSGTVDIRDPIRRAVPYRRTGTVSLGGVR